MLNIWKVVSTHSSILVIGEYEWISSYYMETCFQLRAALLWNRGEYLYTCARWGRTQGPDSFLANSIKCSFLNFSILEGYWLCIGVVLTTLVNEMVPEWAQESDHNINSAYRAYLLVSSYLLSNTSQRIVCINDLTWTSSTCVIIPLSYMVAINVYAVRSSSMG